MVFGGARRQSQHQAENGQPRHQQGESIKTPPEFNIENCRYAGGCEADQNDQLYLKRFREVMSLKVAKFLRLVSLF